MSEAYKNIKPVKVDKTTIIDFQKGRIPPQATDLEEAILGAMMVDKKGAEECLLVLKDSSIFYKDQHKYIFEAIQDLYKKAEPIDMLTVSARLKSMGKLQDAGGDFYLIGLTQKVSSSAHIEFHSRIIMQKYIQRAMIRDCSELISKSYDEDSDIFDLLDDANLKLNSLQEQTNVGVQDMTIGEALNIVEKKIEFLSNKKDGEITGIYTGSKKVDEATDGWQKSDLIVIGARPKMGKTSFVLNTMLVNLKKDIPGGFISLEMSIVQLISRMIACNSHFHLNQIMKIGFKHEKYFQQFNEIKHLMSKYPGNFDDKSRDINDIVSKIRLWKRKYNIQYVIIDYLQIINFNSLGKHVIREQQIAYATRTLKGLAKELDIPIIVLSQLSRELENRVDKRPRLSDLRESGAIEQDADIIAFLYRAAYYNCEVSPDLESMGANTEFIISAYRNGSPCIKGLYFDENKTKFIDPDEIEEINQHDAQMNNEAMNDVPKISPDEAFGIDDKDVSGIVF